MAKWTPMSGREDIHTISLLVANKPGVLVRIALIFSRRGFNIESLVVSPTFDGRFSRMTITAQGDPGTLVQIVKQAQKLVDVVNASEHTPREAVLREFALIKVKVPADKRVEVLQVVNHFKSQTVDIAPESIIVQTTGSSEKIDAMVQMLDQYGILELVRTGKVLMARGKEST